MNRRTILSMSATLPLLFAGANGALAESMDDSEKTLETVTAFMGAMGSGDMETMSNLMADDMVWVNGGDAELPWIGTWEGKETIFGFLGTFSENVQVTMWENEDLFAEGDTAAVFGEMKLKTTNSGVETDPFHFALRAKVEDGQVVYWEWHEDSFAVSQAYHGK